MRARRDRVVRGVAGGLGARTGVDPVLLRIAFVVLTLAGGAGIMLYVAGMAVSDEPADGEDVTSRPLDLQQAAAVGLVGLGVLLMLRRLGFWFGDALVWPAVLAGVASAIIWTRGSGARDAPRAPGDAFGVTGGWSGRAGRVAIGATLTGASLMVFLFTASDPIGVIAPLAGIIVGGVLLLAPWLLRLWEQLHEERDERARASAREEVAAHLHDSVLQTLALIQRSADQPRRMVTLARQQERELRAWLYGDRGPAGPVTLATRVDDIVGEVESAFALDVDVVLVGECPVDEAVHALLSATREALVNVGKHAGVPTASLYLEVVDDRVEVFVRDRGVGFDPAGVADDRRGLADSIRGRVRRAGGGVHVHAAPGEGTEVELWVPRPATAWPAPPTAPTEHPTPPPPPGAPR